MTDQHRWMAALAECESGNQPHAWGDSGQAVGRWQMHPAWVHTWSHQRDMEVVPALGETWDHLLERVLLVFCAVHYTLDALSAAMLFHLGHVAQMDGSEWDWPYAERFRRCYAAATPTLTS